MRLRSMLFVPGDSERKVARAREADADALILDLEDAVAPSRKDAARELTGAVVADPKPRPWRCFVRVNPFDTGLTLADLAAVVRPGLDGLLIPKAESAADLVRVGHYLDAFEQAAGVAVGHVKLAVVATETPAAMFALGSYAPAHPRLVGLTWGGEDLAAAIGATANRDAEGGWLPPYAHARTLCLYAAANAGVAPLETLFADFRDQGGLERSCRAARRDGFVGRLAIHPDQVATINRCFAPSDEEVADARRIVAAFAANPAAGAIGLDGRMLDIPHLKAAQRTLAAAEA